MGWSVVEDAGRGWRRVVASPLPKEIVELDAVKTLIDAGQIVITVGGGGIPVIDRGDGELVGTAAVIDKDFASSLLAQALKADLFLIATAVERVAINFGKPEQKWLEKMTVAEAKAYLEEGKHFAKGSMARKFKQPSGTLKMAARKPHHQPRKHWACIERRNRNSDRSVNYRSR
ncbi:hypothetical protein [Candidatus Villigracilis vicinus]|uniref:amino acid kinase family protein n=1 Tax=Candidatus Villigracilis vicinus TaxID=3140679 RepID=UPI0031E4FEC0